MKDSHLRCLVVLIFSMVLPAQAFDDRERNIYVNQLTSEDGLSGEFVTDIVQDGRGHIWFATQGGINRYDGKSVVVYEHDASDETSLSHNFVFSLYIDRQGDLWVASNGGIDRYDYQADAFERNPFSLPDALQRLRVRDFLQDSRGYFWIGTVDSGVVRVSPDGSIQNYLSQDASGALPDNRIIALVEGSDGRVWVGTDGGGLAYFDPHSDGFVRYQATRGDSASLLSDEIRGLYHDANDNLWVATKVGLSVLDTAAGTFRSFRSDPSDLRSLTAGQVLSVVEDNAGTIWVGTEKGFAEYHAATQSFVRYDRTNRDLEFNNWQINVLFQDTSGVLWFGTNAGVNSWNFISDAFARYSVDSGHLRENLVTSIAEDASGGLWVGTYGGGVSKIDIGASTSERTVTTGGDAVLSLSDSRVMALHADLENRIWVGTRGGGLNLILPDGQVRRFQHDPNNPDSLTGDAISAVASTADGAIWVAAFGSGLNRLDPKTNTIFRYEHDPDNNRSLSTNRVLSLLQDRAGRLWVGTEGGGLNLYQPETNDFRRFSLYDAKDLDAKGTAWALTEDLDGTLWIGTMNQGLLGWPEQQRSKGVVAFSHFGTDIGLPNSIQGIGVGPDQELWVSSNRGLYQLELVTNNVVRYDQGSGLKASDFLQGAQLRGKDGRLYFGSNQGLIVVSPHELGKNSSYPEVHLTAHSRDEFLAKTYSSEIDSVQLANLTNTDPFINFDFAALDYISPDNNRYRYILHGFDSDWIRTDRYAHAVYSNLPPGEYRFEVEAANSAGTWNPQSAKLDIVVPPPFWMSRTAYLLYLLVAAVLIFLGFAKRRKESRRNLEMRASLERQVQERTQALEDGYAELKKLNTRLEEVSVTDSLTGLRNRRFVDGYLKTEIAKLHRHPSGAGVHHGERESIMYFMMIDLDGFKAVNDAYGHDAGDELLLQVSGILSKLVRLSDVVVRWGGDEFMIIGHSATFAGVKVLAERIREALDLFEFKVQGKDLSGISGSIGIAPFPFGGCELSWEQVCRIADRGTYLAKENGRNAWVSLRGTTDFRTQDIDRVAGELEQLVREQRLQIDTALDRELVLNAQDIGIAAR